MDKRSQAILDEFKKALWNRDDTGFDTDKEIAETLEQILTAQEGECVELNGATARYLQEIIDEISPAQEGEKCVKCGETLTPVSYCCLNCDWTWDDSDSPKGR